MKKTIKPRYTLIKGKYWIHNPQNPRQGPQPDGDTIRFEPDSLGLIRNCPEYLEDHLILRQMDRLTCVMKGSTP